MEIIEHLEDIYSNSQNIEEDLDNFDKEEIKVLLSLLLLDNQKIKKENITLKNKSIEIEKNKNRKPLKKILLVTLMIFLFKLFTQIKKQTNAIHKTERKNRKFKLCI